MIKRILLSLFALLLLLAAAVVVNTLRQGSRQLVVPSIKAALRFWWRTLARGRIFILRQQTG